MTTTDPRPLVVVPCHNEAARLDLTRFAALAESGRVRLLFVDDGSTDGTGALLRRLGDLAGVRRHAASAQHGQGRGDSSRAATRPRRGREHSGLPRRRSRNAAGGAPPDARLAGGTARSRRSCWPRALRFSGGASRGALVATTSAASSRPSRRSSSEFPSTTRSAAPRSSARHPRFERGARDAVSVVVGVRRRAHRAAPSVARARSTPFRSRSSRRCRCASGATSRARGSELGAWPGRPSISPSSAIA